MPTLETRWKDGKFDKGVIKIKLTSWKVFSDYVSEELLPYTNYIYRGHGDANWKLEPTLDRIIRDPESHLRREHLERFKYETRGRRGATPPLLKSDNDWWALGQHHGLSTPLLDWTESPFVALYFAVIKAHKIKSKKLTVYALLQDAVIRRNDLIRSKKKVKRVNKRKPTVKLVRPFSDENSRLVSQRGMFTRGPNNMDLETWIKKFYPDMCKEYKQEYIKPQFFELIKITMPNDAIDECLNYLNRMNINHATLYPDLIGASEYCNSSILMPSYSVSH